MVGQQLLARVLMVLAATFGLEAAAAAQIPARSFADLQAQLKVGQRVSIVEGQGSAISVIKGKVVAVTTDELEIRRRRTIFSPEQRIVFKEQWVSRIDSRHIVWKGFAIGLGLGIASSMAIARHAGDLHPEEQGALIWIPVAGAYLGNQIEEMMQDRLLYLSPPRAMPPPVPMPVPRRPLMGVKVRF